MSETTQPSGHCPECGIAVPTGYMRCPKCHAAMPDRPNTPGDAGSARVQGGTSVASGGSGWMYLVGGAAMIAAVIVFIASRGGDDKDTQTSQAKAQGPAPDPGGAGPTMRRDLSVAAPTPAPNPAPGPLVDHKVEAGRLLLSRLESARMWSTVEVQGAGLAIKSGYCEDPAVRETISAITSDLVRGGVKIVTCYERHGPKVFELTLSDSPAGGEP